MNKMLAIHHSNPGLLTATLVRLVIYLRVLCTRQLYYLLSLEYYRVFGCTFFVSDQVLLVSIYSIIKDVFKSSVFKCDDYIINYVGILQHCLSILSTELYLYRTIQASPIYFYSLQQRPVYITPMYALCSSALFSPALPRFVQSPLSLSVVCFLLYVSCRYGCRITSAHLQPAHCRLGLLSLPHLCLRMRPVNASPVSTDSGFRGVGCRVDAADVADVDAHHCTQ